MVRVSLFERIERAQVYTDSLAFSASNVYESIVENLTKMLNTRQGSVQTLPTFGFPDILNLSFNNSQSLKKIANAIEYCIKDFEPRLDNVRVLPLGPSEYGCELRFDIEASLKNKLHTPPVKLRSRLTENGRIEVDRNDL